jgi:amino acid adenylation domain-containing protein
VWHAGPGDTFVDLLRAQVARTPGVTAVAAGQRRVTYAELDRLSARIASALRLKGVRPETVVGVQMDRSLDLLLCVLGILRCAAAYVPMGLEQPYGRTARIIEQSRCHLVLTTAARAARLQAHLTAAGSGPWPRITLIDELLASPDAACPLAVRPIPASLAYVIYTSGSTGVPKGAMVEHRGLLNHLLAKVQELALSPADCVVQNAPAIFDISIWQLLAPLVAGGRVMLVAADHAERPWSLLADVGSEGATVLEVVPAMLGSILEWLEGTHADVTLPRLRWLIVTGEVLPRALCRRWLQRFPGVPIVNAYGPTECSDDVAHHVVRSPLAVGSVPIGHALPGAQLSVLDADGSFHPCDPGALGQLYVGGACVGRGYLGDPRRTAACFVPDPVSGVPGSRLYCTGDLVRTGDGGALEFMGRADLQVKIRGNRVELEDIEAALIEHPRIRAASVVMSEHAQQGSVLTAYLLPRGEPPEADDVRRHLRDLLPPHMVPSRFVLMRALPLTASGKIDRGRLPHVIEVRVRASWAG